MGVLGFLVALALRTTAWEVVYIVGPSRETKVGEQTEAAAGVQVWMIVCSQGDVSLEHGK